MTMRRSPRRPLILKRRKLPFQQNDPPIAEPQSRSEDSASTETSKPAASQCFPDGIRIMDHPSMSDTQVVVIPKTADLQSVIGVLTAKGKESGLQGPNKFILLSENGSSDNGSFCHHATALDNVTTSDAAGHPAKAEMTHSSPDAKPLTAIKQCIIFFLDSSLIALTKNCVKSFGFLSNKFFFSFKWIRNLNVVL